MNRREFAKSTLLGSAMFTVFTSSKTSAEKSDKSIFLADSEGIPEFKPLFNGVDLKGFRNVNTSDDTWFVEDGILKCTGQPIGVMRTEKQYENFILDIEWRHMVPGGNSGVFVWADGTPFKDRPFPTGMEVQMLDTKWDEINNNDPEYTQGHLFPVMGLEAAIPDNPSNIVEGRSRSLEHRVNGTGEWNRYIIVCIDGTLKLSVNGLFVNGIRSPKRKKGYICPESEGSEVHFRKINIMELPGGVITEDQIAPIVEN